jgi:hypothetical protein
MFGAAGLLYYRQQNGKTLKAVYKKKKKKKHSNQQLKQLSMYKLPLKKLWSVKYVAYGVGLINDRE